MTRLNWIKITSTFVVLPLFLIFLYLYVHIHLTLDRSTLDYCYYIVDQTCDYIIMLSENHLGVIHENRDDTHDMKYYFVEILPLRRVVGNDNRPCKILLIILWINITFLMGKGTSQTYLTLILFLIKYIVTYLSSFFVKIYPCCFVFVGIYITVFNRVPN